MFQKLRFTVGLIYPPRSIDIFDTDHEKEEEEKEEGRDVRALSKIRDQAKFIPPLYRGGVRTMNKERGDRHKSARTSDKRARS